MVDPYYWASISKAIGRSLKNLQQLQPNPLAFGHSLAQHLTILK